MKIAPAQFRSFCQAVPSKVQSVLFYGENEADITAKLTTFLQNGLQKKVSDFQMVESNAITKKETFLMDMVSSQSLFGPPQPLFIQKATDKLVSDLKGFLPEYQEKTPIVIVADSYLKPSSKLRQLYEKEDNLAAVACYARTIPEVIQEITMAFKAGGKSIDRMAAQTLAGKIMTGSTSMTSEVDKIINYVGESQELVKLQDIDACVGGDAPEYEEKIYASFLKRNWADIPYLFLLSSYDVDKSEVAVIRGLISKMLQLKSLKAVLEDGKSFDQAVHMTSPPIFFQQKDLMRTAANLWNVPSINKAIDKLTKLEEQVKLEANTASNLMGMSFLKAL